MKKTLHRYYLKALLLHEATQVPYLILESQDQKDRITMQMNYSAAGTLVRKLSAHSSEESEGAQSALVSFLRRHRYRPQSVTITRLGSAGPAASLRYRGLLRGYSCDLQPCLAVTLVREFAIPLYLTTEAIITGTVFNPLAYIDPQRTAEFLYISA